MVTDPTLHWYRDERGQGLTEYAVILAFMAVALVAALGGFGNALLAVYQDIVARLPF